MQRVQVIDFRGLVLALEVTLFSTVLDRIFLCFYTCDSTSPRRSVQWCDARRRWARDEAMFDACTLSVGLHGFGALCHLPCSSMSSSWPTHALLAPND